jgi:hypothetical protein
MIISVGYEVNAIIVWLWNKDTAAVKIIFVAAKATRTTLATILKTLAPCCLSQVDPRHPWCRWIA